MHVGRYNVMSIGRRWDGDWVYIIVITIIFWLYNERKQIIVIINFIFSITIIFAEPTRTHGLFVQYNNCEFVHNSRFGYVG